jgi:hypothetical protein
VIGHGGQHPGERGQDYGDFGPVYGDQESMSGSMNIWIRAVDDWEEQGRSKYNKNYGGKKYGKGKDRDYDRKGNKDRDYDRNDNKDRDYDRKGNKDRDYDRKGNKDKEYDDDDDKDREYGNKDKNYDGKNKYDNDDNDYKRGDRKKRSYSRVKFPVRHFKDIRRFPHSEYHISHSYTRLFRCRLESFPPLLSIFPWLPIFYDRITYQTFIFSPTGGSEYLVTRGAAKGYVVMYL